MALVLLCATVDDGDLFLFVDDHCRLRSADQSEILIFLPLEYPP